MPIVKPTKSLRGLTLDMRVSNKLGLELAQEIRKSVQATQEPIMTDLPSVLMVTPQQFASLNSYTEEMYRTTDRIFRTPHNVMEVAIDTEIDPDNPISQIAIQSEELLKQRKESRV